MFRPSDSIKQATSQLIEESLQAGDVCLTITTSSMSPALEVGDRVRVRRVRAKDLSLGDIVVVELGGTFVAHRLIGRRVTDGEPLFVTKGDTNPDSDSPCEPLAVMGFVARLVRGDRELSLEAGRNRALNRALAVLSSAHRMAMQGKRTKVKSVAAKCCRAGLRTLAGLVMMLFAALFILPLSGASAAVKISAFKATPQGNAIQLTWTTGSEIDNVGFNILRSTSSSGPYAKVNGSIIPSQCLGCMNGSNYGYTDSSAARGQTYFFKLQSVDMTGQTQDFGPASATIGGPTRTPIATVTKTTAAAPTNTRAAPSANVATATSASVAATAPSLPMPPTATRTPARAASTTTRAPAAESGSPVAASATSPAKIAYAVTPLPARPTAVIKIPSSDSAVAEDATPIAGDIQVDESAAEPEDRPVEQPAPPFDGPRAMAALAVYGLAGLFGCGSLVSALFAIALLVRTSRRF